VFNDINQIKSLNKPSTSLARARPVPLTLVRKNMRVQLFVFDGSQKMDLKKKNYLYLTKRFRKNLNGSLLFI